MTIKRNRLNRAEYTEALLYVNKNIEQFEGISAPSFVRKVTADIGVNLTDASAREIAENLGFKLLTRNVVVNKTTEIENLQIKHDRLCVFVCDIATRFGVNIPDDIISERDLFEEIK